MIGHFKRIAMTIAALCVLAGAATAADITNTVSDGYVDLKQVEARFKPAEGMRLSERFDGFETDGGTTEVITALIRSPYDGIAANFTKETLRMRGVDMLSRAELTINGRPALLVKAQHVDGDKTWGKWILLVENGGATLVANGVFAGGDSTASVAVEAMLKGVIPYGEKK